MLPPLNAVDCICALVKILPLALINPPVKMLPAVALPLALTTPAVKILAPVTLPEVIAPVVDIVLDPNAAKKLAALLLA